MLYNHFSSILTSTIIIRIVKLFLYCIQFCVENTHYYKLCIMKPVYNKIKCSARIKLKIVIIPNDSAANDFN